MNLSTLQRRRTAIAIWLVLMLASLAIISRTQFTADLSAFLPRTPTVEQQLLMDQLQDGLASRLILVGIEGADQSRRGDISKAIAQTLRSNSAFVSVNNGEPVSAEADRRYLFNHRYLLSPAVTPERFSLPGLHAAISDSIDQLASPAGLLLKALLPQDPTGEMLQLLEQMDSGRRPQLADGAWASADGNTALLLLQTRALGSDIDAQQQAMQAISGAFTQATAKYQPKLEDRSELTTKAASLVMTGPGVFSVIARDNIKSQVRLIFVISTVLIALLLLAVYRSFTALLLGFLPVASGIFAGIAAVSLSFGVVHGITLGFGTALIGEAVDYSIYLFMQSEHAANGDNEQSRKRWLHFVWPTVRLGVLTSVFGFAALLLSGFPGLAQLGLYSIAGLMTAALMTRYVLPYLLPSNFSIADVTPTGLKLSRYAALARYLRWPASVLLLVASVLVYQHHDHLWNTELSALSPVSAGDQALDARLRSAMGAPDVRYVVVVSANSQEAVLQAAEKVATALDGLQAQGELAAFDSASHYLPSLAMQQARQDSMPNTAELKFRLEIVVKDLPLQPQLFTPFLRDVAIARQQTLLKRSDLDNTSMAMAVDAMLLQQGARWSALLPLTAMPSGIIDAAKVRNALQQAKLSNALFVDVKTETNRLYASYMNEAIVLALVGVLAIIVLLGFVLRSASSVMAVIAPLAAAVLTVTAGLAFFGQQLIILHLIGLLLIVAIGSNYALFFNQMQPAKTALQPISPRTYASLLFANVATVLGFGLLAFSSVPVLQALGMTVAPGVILALIFSAVFAPKRAHDETSI
jgi:predicted exporter